MNRKELVGSFLLPTFSSTLFTRKLYPSQIVEKKQLKKTMNNGLSISGIHK